MVYQEDASFSNSFQETDEAEDILQALNNEHLKIQIDTINKVYKKVLSENKKISDISSTEKAETYKRSLQDIRDFCKTGIQHLKRLLELSDEGLQLLAHGKKRIVHAVKPMVSGHVISNPTIKLRRHPLDALISRVTAETPDLGESSSATRFPSSRQAIGAANGGSFRSSEPDDILDIEVQQISRRFVSDTPSSSSGASVHMQSSNLFSPQSESILNHGSPPIDTIEAFHRNSQELNDRMDYLRRNILKNFKLDTSKLRNQQSPPRRSQEPTTAIQTSGKTAFVLLTRPSKVSRRAPPRKRVNPAVILERLNFKPAKAPKASSSPRVNKKSASKQATPVTSPRKQLAKCTPMTPEKSKKLAGVIKPVLDSKKKRIVVKKSPKVKIPVTSPKKPLARSTPRTTEDSKKLPGVRKPVLDSKKKKIVVKKSPKIKIKPRK